METLVGSNVAQSYITEFVSLALLWFVI